MRLGYLYSRYPVLSQTFCDMEMLALERRGWPLTIASVYPPLTSLRHEHIARLRAPIHYAPPQPILRSREKEAKAQGRWPAQLVDLHARKYGPAFKAEQRARNALWFAELFTRSGVEHFHVHFANRAAHTALFVKEMSGLTFSMTAHGQDFMTDLGNDDLLREISGAAEFVAAETDYSRDLLRTRCPDSAANIHRVYNGMDLDAFPPPIEAAPTFKPRILSVGRLVAFKGFEHLIDACAELARRGVDFTCEIVGDGPLREQLQGKIDMLALSSRVALVGSLSQHAVFEKLRASHVFALAAVVDAQGGSDVFPTVILEAMAAARPVVSSWLAGIPESVVNGETGFLVQPGDTAALVNALERLLLDPDLRTRFGKAGRARIEQQFRVDRTIEPLIELLENSVTVRQPSPATTQRERPRILYLIDRWPNATVAGLRDELHALGRSNLRVATIVCEFDPAVRMTAESDELARHLDFLPDALALEAEWRANESVAQQLEETRARQQHRAPTDLFLRSARFALFLQKRITSDGIVHVHATSSRALPTALMLQELTGVTVSTAMEAKQPQLPREWLAGALERCVGGRLPHRQLDRAPGGGFLLERSGRFHLTSRAKFWQEWTALLQQWSNRPSKIDNRQ